MTEMENKNMDVRNHWSGATRFFSQSFLNLAAEHDVYVLGLAQTDQPIHYLQVDIGGTSCIRTPEQVKRTVWRKQERIDRAKDTLSRTRQS